MKKALIIVCSCLLIAVVALCLVWNNLNGQKTELADKLEVSDRTLSMTVEEAKTLEDGKKAAEARVAELEGLLTAAAERAAVLGLPEESAAHAKEHKDDADEEQCQQRPRAEQVVEVCVGLH